MSRWRHLLVASISGGAVIVIMAAAKAQGVVMCTNCSEEVTTLANDLAVAANWVTQLERMTAQIQQQILIFQQLSGLTNVNGMAAILNQAGNFDQMGTFGNVPDQLMGAGGGIGAGYQAANDNALPVGSPMPLLAAVQKVFNQRAGSLASMQGISAQLLTNSNVILAGLRTLQQLIDNQPSSQLMGGMNSRLSAYQGNIASQQYQLSQAQAFANAQQKVFDQKEQQAVFCSAYGWANDNPSLTGAGLNLGATNCVGGAGGVGVPVAGVGTGGVVLAGATLPATGGVGTAGGEVDIGGFDTPPVTAAASTATALPVPPIPPTTPPPVIDDLGGG
jgi:Type IV secretion system proteins